MVSLVATPDPVTGTVRVDVEQTRMYDLATRVVAGTWGTPTSGLPAWTNLAGAPANFAVSGNSLQHIFAAIGPLVASAHATSAQDFDLSFNTFVNNPPTGASGDILQFFVARAIGGDYVRIVIFRQVSGSIVARMDYVRGAAVIISPGIVLPGVTAGGNIGVRFRGCGNLIQMKFWPAGSNEPAAWNDQMIVPEVWTGTMNLQSQPAGALTNPLPIIVSYDNVAFVVGQPLRLYRVTTDGVRTEVIGSPFNTDPFWPNGLFTGTIVNSAVMWDSDAPFDTNLFYEVTSNCGELAITSNTVVLDSDGDGWLRDPLDPTLNLRIVMDAFFDECVDQDVVVFSGLDAREYENASGIFDHIDARRPVTVSMTRKNYGSALTLTSFSLDDVDGLENIFDSGRILALSLPMVYGWAHRTFGTDYITMFDITQSLFSVDQRVTTRIWTIPFRLSPEPADTIEGGVGGNGIGGGGATYDDLAASVLGTTYNSLTASGQTYTQVAQGVGY